MSKVVPLAEELQISDKEWKTTAKQIKRMLEARNDGELSEEQISQIFEEWVTIAKRINKGGRMIKQTAAAIKSKPEPELLRKMDKLVGLYTFLLHLLGFYDEYFRVSIEKEHHKRLQSAIVELLEL